MTTIKEQVLDALEETGEKPEELRCFIQPCHDDDYHYDSECTPPKEVSFADLPERDYDSGYGGVEGPAFIAFGPGYVYIRGEYDGSEWITAIPRHPEYLGDKTLPSVGGS